VPRSASGTAPARKAGTGQRPSDSRLWDDGVMGKSIGKAIGKYGGLASGKLLHNYGKMHHFEGEHSLFRLGHVQ